MQHNLITLYTVYDIRHIAKKLYERGFESKTNSKLTTFIIPSAPFQFQNCSNIRTHFPIEISLKALSLSLNIHNLSFISYKNISIYHVLKYLSKERRIVQFI